MAEEPGGRGKISRGARRVLQREAGNEKSSSDRGAVGGELHGADGSAGAVVRTSTAFSNGIYSERGQGVADRVFCSAATCCGCHSGSGAAAGSDRPALDDFGDPCDCSG